MRYIELAEAVLEHLYSDNQHGNYRVVELSDIVKAVGEQDMVKACRVANWLDQGGYINFNGSSAASLTTSGAILAELIRLPSPNLTSAPGRLTELLQTGVIQL